MEPTEDEIANAAQEAAGKTWKWWGSIERPWAPDPYIVQSGPNLVEWFKHFFRANPRHMENRKKSG